MFGYIAPDIRDLSEIERERFRSYYCGVCKAMQKDGGNASRLFLSYDMTFLALLLTALYEDEPVSRDGKCLLHPLRPRQILSGEYIDYAADMNILLAYHKLTDDLRDGDRKFTSFRKSLISASYTAASLRRPDLDRFIAGQVAEQFRIEQSGNPGIDEAASPTSRILERVYRYREDVFADSLSRIGSAVGRFIYIMDAYDDLERDSRKGVWNPLTGHGSGERVREFVTALLTSYMQDVIGEIELLPLTYDTGLLYNILYRGVWYRLNQIDAKESKKNG